MRVLANIVPNEYWMGTMLHELGHSVYSSKNIPQTRALRRCGGESHILTTEGVAMMFERFSQATPPGSRRWACTVADPKAFDETGAKMLREPAADLLALVPGDAALREGDVREPRPGPEQALVGPGREVPAGAAARRAATPRTTPARSTSSAPRSTTTTT